MPAQYIVGRQRFFNPWIDVNPSVFIPRSYTEEYVAQVLQRLQARTEPKLTVAEVGTGSGADSIAVAVNEARAALYAVDMQEATVARRGPTRRRGPDRVPAG